MKEENEKLSPLSVIFTGIKIVCIILLILLIVVLGIQRFSNNKKAIGGYRVFNVATGSMIPVYEIGDVVLIKEINTDELKKEDVVTYLGKSGDFSGRVVTHRIKDIEETETGKVFHTQGDANDTEDPVITADQIYGKVVYKFILVSMLTKLMNNLTAFYILIFIPLALLIFLQMKDVLDAKREEKETDENDEE